MSRKKLILIFLAGTVVLVVGAYVWGQDLMRLRQNRNIESTIKPAGDDFLGFTYNGQPIHPNCVAEAIEDKAPYEGAVYPVSLRACTEEGRRKEGARSALAIANGEVSLDYGFDVLDGREFSLGYFSYQAEGRQGNSYLVSTNSSGGGTGQFSSLAIVQKTDGSITTTKVIASGDRCQGSITGSELRDGKVYFSKYVGAAGAVDVVMGTSTRSGLYAGYADCGISANYAVALHGDADPELISAEVDMGKETYSGSEDKLFNCFGRALLKHVPQGSSGIVILTPDRLKGLAEDYLAMCREDIDEYNY